MNSLTIVAGFRSAPVVHGKLEGSKNYVFGVVIGYFPDLRGSEGAFGFGAEAAMMPFASAADVRLR